MRRAVATDRVGHAYLFCGPRGVGKTTLARVLAMALNCPDRTDDGEPCGVCDSCSRIWGGHTALDVVEIDAASNRGVDDARDLRERAMYAPSGDGRTKVYIVDEAHMLTREAWNALLKILEEPPPRVIFVFATTEPQKIQQVAAPILSRCQRFDLRRIGVSDIVAQLTRVLGGEEAAAPEDALRLIARKADGGMRDALSLLDQVLSLTGGSVEVDAVRRVLGLVEDERYLELLDILRDARHEEVFGLVERLIDDGYDLVEFYHGLLDVLRVLLRLRLAPDAEVDLQDDVRAQLVDRAAAFAPGDLVRMLSSAADLESQGSLRRSPNPRLPIEMLLLRMSFLDRTVSLEALIGALGGAPEPSGGAGRSGSGGESGGVQGGNEAAGHTATGVQTDVSVDLSAHEEVSREEPEASTDQAGAPPETGQSFTALMQAALQEAEPSLSSDPAPGASAVKPNPEPRPRAIEPVDDIVEAWRRWLSAGRGIPTGLSAFLNSSEVHALDDGGLAVRPIPGPAYERMATPPVIDALTEGLTPYLGRRPVVRIDAPGDGADTSARITREEVREDTLQALYRQEPRLEQAVQELDLELMD